MSERPFYLTCEKCIHYSARGVTAPPTGTCHRNAPRPIVEGEMVAGNPEWLNTRWPVVNADDWCGEFRAPVFSDTPGSYS